VHLQGRSNNCSLLVQKQFGRCIILHVDDVIRKPCYGGWGPIQASYVRVELTSNPAAFIEVAKSVRAMVLDGFSDSTRGFRR
jgi:hypothetical protein